MSIAAAIARGLVDEVVSCFEYKLKSAECFVQMESVRERAMRVNLEGRMSFPAESRTLCVEHERRSGSHESGTLGRAVHSKRRGFRKR